MEDLHQAVDPYIDPGQTCEITTWKRAYVTCDTDNISLIHRSVVRKEVCEWYHAG